MEQSTNTMSITEFLTISGHEGEENAISSSDLAAGMGFSSVRELQKHIASERMAGAIICSGSSKGYWLPADLDEIRKFNRNMNARAMKILVASKSARTALKDPEGQTDIITLLQEGAGSDE